MTQDQLNAFMQKAYDAAVNAHHVWPVAAAAEAALESNWGRSALALDNNLFGMKQHSHPVYGTVSLPTREFLDDKWVKVSAAFVEYPDWTACYQDRMTTLTRLAPSYPHYAAALAATDPETYLTEVSKSWSTDPERAANCITILRCHQQFIKQGLPSSSDLDAVSDPGQLRLQFQDSPDVSDVDSSFLDIDC